MFVMACRYDPASPVIFEAVSSIRWHQPDEPIYVVDSCSPDQSYLRDLENYVDYIDTGNTEYAIGAWKRAYQNFPTEEFFYCMHDSLILEDSLEDLKVHDVSVVRWFDGQTTGWGWDEAGIGLDVWGGEMLRKFCQTEIPTGGWKGVFGPMVFVKQKVLHQLDAYGFFNIPIKRKYDLSAMERMTGIMLGELGYDFASQALQGEMVNFFGPYDESRVRKLNVGRM